MGMIYKNEYLHQMRTQHRRQSSSDSWSCYLVSAPAVWAQAHPRAARGSTPRCHPHARGYEVPWPYAEQVLGGVPGAAIQKALVSSQERRGELGYPCPMCTGLGLDTGWTLCPDLLCWVSSPRCPSQQRLGALVLVEAPSHATRDISAH